MVARKCKVITYDITDVSIAINYSDNRWTFIMSFIGFKYFTLLT